jgi:malonate-semialdehyde dehydrogenase (acetylating)/methylmalonate-semialdehyde dehydrogenase
MFLVTFHPPHSSLDPPSTLCSLAPCYRSGPLISPAAKERVESLIQSCADQGGKISLDGRGVKVEGYLKGNFVGPTILEATTDMDCYQCVIFTDFLPRISGCGSKEEEELTKSLTTMYRQEIFGPVLTVVKAKDLDDALALINRNRCQFPFLLFYLIVRNTDPCFR